MVQHYGAFFLLIALFIFAGTAAAKDKSNGFNKHIDWKSTEDMKVCFTGPGH
jgi:hypothetical protein